MVGQANIINKFANVRMEDLRGMRVPFLRVGWNRQFLMMKEFGFVYDSSMVAPFSNPPLWPYTLDFKMPHTCTGNNQVTATHCRSFAIYEFVKRQRVRMKDLTQPIFAIAALPIEKLSGCLGDGNESNGVRRILLWHGRFMSTAFPRRRRLSHVNAQFQTPLHLESSTARSLLPRNLVQESRVSGGVHAIPRRSGQNAGRILCHQLSSYPMDAPANADQLHKRIRAVELQGQAIRAKRNGL